MYRSFSSVISYFYSLVRDIDSYFFFIWMFSVQLLGMKLETSVICLSHEFYVLP